MTRAQIWEARVRAWQASGEGLTDFCRGKEFTASAMRYWIPRSQVEAPKAPVAPKPKKPKAPKPRTSVRLARVVRSAARVESPSTPVRPNAGTNAEVFVIELGSLRVHVPSDIGTSRLEDVLVAIGRAGRSGAA